MAQGIPDSVDAPCVTQIGVTDTDKDLASYAANAAVVALAVANWLMAYDFIKKQDDIARDYLKLEKNWRNHYKTYAAIEDQELEDAKNLPDYEPLYDVAIGRARNTTKSKIFIGNENSVRGINGYSIGALGQRIKDVAMPLAPLLTSASTTAYRNERAFKDAMNDRKWKRRREVANRGRDMLANDIAFSQFASGIFGDIGGQALQSFNGALTFLGYSTQRRQTIYPITNFTGQQQGAPSNGLSS